MNIKKLFKQILEDIPTNAISGMAGDGGRAIEIYDKPLQQRKKKAHPLTRLQKTFGNTFTGPTQIPSDNPVTNTLNNKNKGILQNPLEYMKKNDPVNKILKRRTTDRKTTKTKGLVQK